MPRTIPWRNLIALLLLPSVPGFLAAAGKVTFSQSAGNVETFDFVEVTISNSSAKTLSAQRLVIGSAVEAVGVDYDAESGFSTRSVVQSGAGWVGTLKYAEAVPTWKITFSGISNASWRSDWQAFLQWAEGRDAFLFVPDIADAHSNDVIYGRITTAAKGSTAGYDMWSVELAIEALAP